MYKFILTSCILLFLTYKIQAQFVEMGQGYGSNLPVAVIGKDANGDLYGVYQSNLYKKADNFTDGWQSIASGNHFSNFVVSEKANYKMFSYSFNELYSSSNGINWDIVSSLSNNDYKFIKYLENDHLIVATQGVAYISTDGGFSFKEFYPSEILSIVWDWVNNRYVFTTPNGLFFKNTIQETATTLFNGTFHQAPTTIANGYYLAIGINGDIYGTEASAFPYIKKYIVANDSLYSFYPIGTSSPLHATGLLSTKTGRVYCLSWSNFSAVLIEDEGENYASNIPQGGIDSYFMDKLGYLYLNSISGISGAYSKSDYSVRQPVFFKPMLDIYGPSYYQPNREGIILRTDNNQLLSIDAKGIVYQSNDVGETWDSIANIANIQNFRTVKFVYKQNDGKLIAGVGYQVYESTDNGYNWTLNSTLSDSYDNGFFIDAAYKTNGDYHFYIKQDLILRSQNDGDSVERKAQITISTPNFGVTSSFQCIEITDQGTILVGGYINNGYVYRSTNNLDSMDIIEPLGQRQQSINDIFQDKNGKIWLAAYKGVLYSLDDGQTWAMDSTYPELTSYQFLEDSEGNLITTGNQATYMLKNNKWERISYGYYGLNFGFYNLYLDPESDYIFANGVYKTSTATPQLYTSLIENKEQEISNIDLDFYPNPSANHVNILNEIGEESKITIYNQLGQIMQSFTIDKQSDLHQINIDNFNKGIYLIVKEQNGISTTKKIVKY